MHRHSFQWLLLSDQSQMSRAEGVHGEWEGTDQGIRESPEFEVQLFGGTVCSGETVFLQ